MTTKRRNLTEPVTDPRGNTVQGFRTEDDPPSPTSGAPDTGSAGETAPPSAAVPFAWARGWHQPSNPHGPDEYGVEFSESDDPPEGKGWFPLYRAAPLPPARTATAEEPVAWLYEAPWAGDKDSGYRDWHPSLSRTDPSNSISPVRNVQPLYLAAAPLPPARTATAEQIERIAKWLHGEVEWPDPNFPYGSWPDHPDDTGQRGDGWLKVIPKDTQEQFRDIARRLFAALALAPPPVGEGWRCFHCDEVFTTVETARAHFGVDDDYEPGCMLKLTEEEKDLHKVIARLQGELHRYHIEDSDADRRHHAQQFEHGRALIREEEKGYARGLADGRLVSQPSAPTAPDTGTDDVPLALVRAKIAHALKRQKTDVNISDARPFWRGYIAALRELTDYIDAQRLLRRP